MIGLPIVLRKSGVFKLFDFELYMDFFLCKVNHLMYDHVKPLKRNKILVVGILDFTLLQLSSILRYVHNTGFGIAE